MTDDLRFSLLELEQHAPDADAVRAAVHQGILIRTRRRRLAVTTAAAVAVAALAAGAVAIGGHLADNTPPVLHHPDKILLVPPVSALLTTFPVDPRKVESGRTPRWHRDHRETTVLYRGGGKPTVSITARQMDDLLYDDLPPDGRQPEDTTVSGHPAKLYNHKGQKGQFEVLWREPSGLVISVTSDHRDVTMEVANGLIERAVRLPAHTTFGLAPSGWEQRTDYDVCRPDDQDWQCISIRKDKSVKITDGPEPVDRRPGCRTHNDVREPIKVGAPQRIDGALVQLSSDGCAAVRRLADGSHIYLQAPPRVDMTPWQLGRILASVKYVDQ